MSSCSDSARTPFASRSLADCYAPQGGWSRLSPLGLRTFFRLADRWALTPREQAILLASTAASIRRWRRSSERSRLHRDQIERISTLIAIDAGITALLPPSRTPAAWLRDAAALPFANGTPPLSRMLGGHVSDLLTVLSLIDYATPPVVKESVRRGAVSPE